MPNDDVKLKLETSWYYQIQGQMAITEVGNTDLIVCTNKKILVVTVPFNESFWQTVILEKLKLFFMSRFLCPEILSQKIFKALAKSLEPEE